MKAFITILITILSISITYAQVGINADGSTPHSSAILDVKSTTKAFYPPRMTTAEKEAIVGNQIGALVFDATLNQLSVFNGTAWVSAGSSLTLPYIGTYTSPIFTPGGSTLDISNNSGTEATGITGRSNAVVTGAGVYGVANSTSPLTDIAGVSGRSESTNANGVGVKAFHTGLGSAFFGSSTNGIAASLNSTNGFALKTQGKLQLAGNGVGTLGIGKILKSSTALGDAQWADLIPISESKSLNSTLISLTNTLATNNLPVILASTNSNADGETIEAKAANTAPTGYTVAVKGTNESTNALGAGLYGDHRGSGTGVVGNSYSGIGVFGDGGTGVKGEGVYGVHGIGSQRGVFGEKSGTTGSAIHGVGGLHGVYGQSEGYGVYGVSNYLDPNQYKYAGVYGESNSDNEYGSGVNGTHWGNGPGVNGYSPTGVGGRFNSDGGGYALVTQTGNVGIGTTTPAAKMDIKGSDYLSHFYYGANEDTYIRGGTAGSRVLINDVTGQGSVGIGIANPNQYLDVKGRMRIYNSTFGTAGIWMNNAVNGLGSGDGAFVGINCSAAGTETVGFFVGGQWRFDVDRAGNGRFDGTVTTTAAFTCASDFRFKKNIKSLDNALTRIQKINGVSYNWRKEEFPDKNFTDQNQIGFIAQDLEKIYPEMVFTDTKGYKSIDYARLTPVLVEAIKELKKENDNLKAENKTFGSRLDKLEEILNAFAKK